jgi:hypothetical protein
MQENYRSTAETLKLNEGAEKLLISDLLDKSRSLPAGEPFTYGATPLDRMTTLQQQLELALSLQELTYRDIPEDVPIEIIDYVHTTFATRFHGRGEANEENNMTSLLPSDQFGEDEQAMFRRADLGQASPSELLVTRNLKGIRSVELACLTHPYGKRIDPLLYEMRESVRQHVELLHGTYIENPDTRYRVKEIVGYVKGEEKLDKGVLMTRKRTIGVMPDGTVIRERSSFVLRLDDRSPLTKAELTRLNEVDLSKPHWQDELVSAADLDTVASMLLEMDEYSLAIPVSTTIYAFNAETAEAVTRNEADKAAKRKARFAIEHPILAAAMNENHTPLRIAEFRGEMYYNGPTEPSDEPADI